MIDTLHFSAEVAEAAAMPQSAADGAKRQQIMDGARRVFLERGFDGASIGDIVRSANVSKGTLYAYFPSKEKLFEVLVFEDRRKQAEVLFVLDETDEDVARVLSKLGVTFLEMLMQPETLAFFRMVIGASAQFPEIGRNFYTAGPCFGTDRLASYLMQQTTRGALAIDNTKLAARQFLDLCKTGVHLRMLLGQDGTPARSEIEENVESAVRIFLAGYGSRRGAVINGVR